MGSNPTLSARQLKCEAGLRRLCAFWGEIRVIRAREDSERGVEAPDLALIPGAVLCLQKHRVIWTHRGDIERRRFS